MGYLERNAAIASEINDQTRAGNLTLANSEIVFTNERHYNITTVKPIGSFQSEITRGKLYIAQKKHSAPFPDTFVQELAVIEGIATDFPHLEPALPAFMTWNVGQDGEWNGYLMDDFSEGGRKKVASVDRQMGNEKGMFPEELYDWIPYMHEEELSHMCFFVGDEQTLRLGDFNTALVLMEEEEREERFKLKAISERLQEFTVFVPAESIQ